ncbi:serine--tRNA ligase [Candidatus Saccharibacteria bacterium]|nr:serine--tRNA ligase [Candidatus Saccharibacteria bacterium]MCL1962847.1 serine--tRNA ligase [Candidatus Saccharibacteria bacterium]
MMDIKFIRENADAVQQNNINKGYTDLDVAELLEIDNERRDLQTQVDTLREQKNQIAAQMKNGKPNQELIDQGKQIKIQLMEREEYLRATEAKVDAILSRIPNMIFDDVPLGGEEKSVEVKTWGEKRVDAKIDHLDYMIQRDWVDFERGAKVAGTKFYYLKNEAVLLEQALINYAQNKLFNREIGGKRFTLMTTPDMVNEKILQGVGFAPRSEKEDNDYFVEGADLSLIATAEIPLTGYHAGEILDEKDLPILYAGFSPCFRREAGAAGKHGRGLFRVHQFNKVEMYCFSLPEDSRAIHDEILAIEEEIWQELGIPYHIINIASGDLGAPAAKKFDLEYWSPIDEKYRELTSCSNCTTFQANSLNIRVRRGDGRIETVHTLNGTAISLARALITIIENYAQPDGKFIVPEVLRKFLGKEVL